MAADRKQTLLHASLIQSIPCGCSDSMTSMMFFLWSHWMQDSADLFRLKLHISRIFSYTTNREGPVVFWLFAYIKTAWICFRFFFFFFSLKALHLVKKVRHQMLSRTVLLKKSNLEYLHSPYQLQKIFFFFFCKMATVQNWPTVSVHTERNSIFCLSSHICFTKEYFRPSSSVARYTRPDCFFKIFGWPVKKAW